MCGRNLYPFNGPRVNPQTWRFGPVALGFRNLFGAAREVSMPKQESPPVAFGDEPSQASIGHFFPGHPLLPFGGGGSVIGAAAWTCSGMRSAWLCSLRPTPLESDHAGKVEQPVEQHRCDDGINEDVAPVDVMITEPFPCRALTRRRYSSPPPVTDG